LACCGISREEARHFRRSDICLDFDHTFIN
jgi:hypothetical protein